MLEYAYYSSILSITLIGFQGDWELNNTAIESKIFKRLRYYNLFMDSFHLLQGILVLMLSNDFSLPVTANFLNGPPVSGGGLQQIETLFFINIAWTVATFVFLSAIAHYTVAFPGVFGKS